MSKQRARRRAVQRQQRAHPKPHPRPVEGAASERRAKPQPTPRERRRRQRWTLMVVGWLLVNGLTFLLTLSSDHPWSTRWVVLVLSTMAVPVLVWLLWDPEGRVDL